MNFQTERRFIYKFYKKFSKFEIFRNSSHDERLIDIKSNLKSFDFLRLFKKKKKKSSVLQNLNFYK